jgi:peptide/nickel transport system permease protein
MSMLRSADTIRADEAQSRLQPKSSSPVALFRFVRRYPLGALGGAILLAMILTAIFAPWLAPHDPQQTSVERQYAPPGRGLILGGDHLGRDVLSRLIYGARISLSVGLLSVGIGVTAGTLIGVFSAVLRTSKSHRSTRYFRGQ